MTTLLLAGTMVSCSGGEHPICKDDKSTKEYSLQWQDDLAEASTSGKVSTEKVVAIQGKMYENLGLLAREKWSEHCNLLDKLRSESGF
ncbi:hypothetical protein [Parasphingorhabdus halotolerans]|uniref:Uncharacterized protein n=1 Tax=Parasphingorhabdus halotolerans TaxID=2725558 RepID=A0A6H2DL32_9SPHN|nr:hypothetical protein [Parasphingorhabdus halotolerans]QJB68693.1 hypothetical protein HF685_04860 [Parasphingorhabdus halotolerans]